LYDFYFPFTDAENSELDQLLGELLSLGQDLASGVDVQPVVDTSSWESRTEGTWGFSAGSGMRNGWFPIYPYIPYPYPGWTIWEATNAPFKKKRAARSATRHCSQCRLRGGAEIPVAGLPQWA